MTWRITFTDGSTETTPPGCDSLRPDVDNRILAVGKREYGAPFEPKIVYVLANVRKWEVTQ